MTVDQHHPVLLSEDASRYFVDVASTPPRLRRGAFSATHILQYVKKAGLMNFDDTQKLIAFHYWARNRMLEALDPMTPEQFTKELGGSFGSVRNTVVHTLSAECVWLSRWKGESPTGMLVPDEFPDLASVRRAWSENESKLRSFFETAGEEGIQKVIPYKSLSGVPSQSILWQMLQHVVNHASYHRGQITTFLRQLGCAPPKPTDLIAFYRENP